MSMLTRRSGAAVAVAALGAWLVAAPVAEMSSIAVLGLLLFAGPAAEAQEGAKRLQGQVPLKDQLSGRSLQGYKQHVVVVGHQDVMKRGNNGHLWWLDDCAYFRGGAGTPNNGVAVLDVNNPSRPRLVNIIPAVPGFGDFSLEANPDSRMLVIMSNGSAGSLLRIYDIDPADCTRLVARGIYNMGTEDGRPIIVHELRIWRDKIYATVTSPIQPGPTITVVDASDKDNPVLLTTWDLSDEPGMAQSAAHNLDLTPDGTRAYVNIILPRPGEGLLLDSESGLTILDTSGVANWRLGDPRPTIPRVSGVLLWSPPNAGVSHTAQLVKIKGRKYVLAMNEAGLPRCPLGWAQVIDVNDEPKNLIPISTFRLEVNKPENCARTLPDHAQPASLAYSSHYLGVDDPEEAKLVAFTWYSSGLRVVDISDPYDPKEVGYFMPPAVDKGTGPPFRADRAYSWVRFYKGNLWFVSIDGGFWVVRFTGKDGDDDRDDD